MQLIITHIQDLQSARYYNAFENTSLAFSIDALSIQGMTVAGIKSMISWLHDPNICLYALDYQERDEILFLAREISARTIICNNTQAKGLHFPHIILTKNISINKNSYTQAVMVKDSPDVLDTETPYFLPYNKDILPKSSEQHVGYYANACKQDMGDEDWVAFLENL